MKFLKTTTLLWAIFLTACGHVPEPIDKSRIIDAHKHGSWPEGQDTPYRQRILSEMQSNGVRLSVISLTDYDDVENWADVESDAFLAGVMLPCPKNLAEPYYKCFPSTEGWVDVEWLRGQVKAGKIRAIHEVLLNYYGIAASDPKLDPYFSLAAEFDLPVGIHITSGPPPGAPNSLRSDSNCCPNYNGDMGNPALLRPVLEKYPGLRIWLQHAGAGGVRGLNAYWDETMALLRDYPQIHLDLSITNSVLPIALYDVALSKLIDAGYGDRIMFGSDNQSLELILQRFHAIEWLSDDQRKAILFENAERYFKLAP